MTKASIHQPKSYDTLVKALQSHALENPDSPAFGFLTDGEKLEQTMTFAQLDARARQIGAYLQDIDAIGERIVLLYPPCLEFIAAFMGCLYAGAVAVPVSPPHSVHTAPRLLSILQDADPCAILSSESSRDILDLPNIGEDIHDVHWQVTEILPGDLAAAWKQPEINSSTLAFLQYTSGSTGNPKGVIVTHDNLLHNYAMLYSSFERDTEDIVTVSWLPLYHDMGLIGHVISPMVHGCQSIIMSPFAFLKRPIRWLEAISKFKAHASGGPNFAYRLCVEKTTPDMREGLDLSTWRTAYSGAEPVRSASFDRFAETFAPYGFDPQARIPVYGLAEATLFVTGGTQPFDMVTATVSRSKLSENSIEPASPDSADATTLVGCGHAWLEQEVVIVDPDTCKQVEDGIVGEIWVRGRSVAKGYWNKPELTKQTFGAVLDGEGGYLRTGDLGFIRENELFITGRVKDLIIVRGYNHYPEDIELTVEKSHEAIRQGSGAVFSLTDGDTEELVIAYELKREYRQADLSEVVTAIRRNVLEAHQLPIHTIVFLKRGKAMKTSSGKIQRQAMKQAFMNGQLEEIARDGLDEMQARALENYVAPETETQTQIVAIWSEVLDQQTVGILDNFFDIGGNSLTATQVIARIRETLEKDVPLRTIFESPTPALLAEAVDAAPEAVSLTSEDIDESHTLTYSQERMWFLYQMDPLNDAYNVTAFFHVEGELNVAALKKSLEVIIQRHEPLRSVYVMRDGKPTQVTLDKIELPFELVDLGDFPEQEREAEAIQRIGVEMHQPFDIENGPVFRTRLYRLDEQNHMVMMVLHHIVSDAWTFKVIWHELAQLYQAYETGTDPALEDLPLQMRSFAAWQRTILNEESLKAQAAYWKQQLDGARAILELPTDYPRPPVQTFNGKAADVLPIDKISGAIRRLAAELDVTPYMIYLSAFYILLYMYTRQDDILVASPIANRKTLSSESLVGSFVNTLVMRGTLNHEMTFANLIHQTRQTALEAYENQDLPFDQVVGILQPERTPSHSPLAQVMFSLANAPMQKLELGKTTWHRVDTNLGVAQFDLSLTMLDTAGMEAAQFSYNADLFVDETVRRMGTQYMLLLEAIIFDVHQPISSFSPYTEDDEKQLQLWNDTQVEFPADTPLHKLIEAQIERTPDRIAATYAGTNLTYTALNEKANQFAHYLQELGVGPESMVGIHLPRSLEMLITLLGVMKAGASYVPLDPGFPQDRLEMIIEDSGLAVMVSRSDIVGDLARDGVHEVLMDRDENTIAANPTTSLAVNVSSSNLLYTIFTSGSTGRPKGVQIEHRSTVNFINSMRREPGLTADDVLIAVTTLSFDIAVLELYLPLTVGARVVIATREETLDGNKLRALIEQENATVMQATPATWQLLFDAGWQGKADLKVLCGGEAMPVDLAQRLLVCVQSLWNMYGPTETTVWSTVHHVESADGFIPIGHPIDNTIIYILDSQKRPVPIGVPGELYIGGDGLARGYLNRPELNAEKFVPDPFRKTPGARMYSTGDLARFRVDGTIQFFGRLDFQVKVRGFRIELGDIETVLGQHPAVRQNVVIVREDTPNNKQLVGYIITDTPDVDSLIEIRQYLQDKLPSYMVPSFLMPVDEFPLTPNGKINRRALPKPLVSQMLVSQGFAAPTDDVEQMLVDIWSSVLKVEQVGIHDDFFNLGGHSLLAVRVVASIEEKFGVNLPLATLFQRPTIAQLAEPLRDEAKLVS